jgi:uncharacterized protein (DUF1015 family)
MARIRPFAAWRYVSSHTDITPLTAPPYDVISEHQRLALLEQDPHNVVALELPEGPMSPEAPANRYETGQKRWDQWRQTAVLNQDPTAAIYVLEQRFTLAGSPVRRRAFIVEVGLEPFSAGIVLPHERTLPKALGDRFNLTVATRANLSQVFGLFDDPECQTDVLFETAMSSQPVATATDAEGVESTLWAATDPDFADALTTFMADRGVFIADGHHRYTTALAYRDLRREQAEADGTGSTDGPAYEYVLMALVNMDDPDLVVLPTHRVADAPGPFDAQEFKRGLAAHFELSELSVGSPSDALDSLDATGFVVKTSADDRPFLARLRPDVDVNSAIPLKLSAAWKSLDVAALQELVLSPLLDIHPDRAETLDRLHFIKDAHDALEATADHDVAFVLRATRMDQLREVALAGETMPQKSTYFYPKLLSGLLFRSAE